MSIYGDIEDLAEVYFGEPDALCPVCHFDDYVHDTDCPLDPVTLFAEPEGTMADEEYDYAIDCE